MSVSQQEELDFSMMYATHDAFRRDLKRFEAAAAAGKGGNPKILAGWENFKTQLLIHHGVEDSYLWPRVENAVAGRAHDLALLKDMKDEHAQLDPLLARVDEALAGRAADLADRIRDVAAVLGDHLTHEEDSALPLIQAVLPRAEWDGMSGAMARREGVKGAAYFVPWVLEEKSPAERQRILARLPAPARLLNRLLWQPRYLRRNLWNG
ncbi:hemerythrin HHE cation binding domain-containing protein [Frankia torreyi]|uniref:Hemerythrin HHE cation binding domain-containing protein n=3 Tax=Frankiaceae TaxID=74712 RepID=A0A0D8BH69_9ACTN|nr:hemerythrin HHE cation binding domain-containing protein [Frankia torreyi]KQC40024.1 hemerythrin HHE cation-binding protein [Frankia sp. ACN1ag]